MNTRDWHRSCLDHVVLLVTSTFPASISLCVFARVFYIIAGLFFYGWFGFYFSFILGEFVVSYAFFLPSTSIIVCIPDIDCSGQTYRINRWFGVPLRGSMEAYLRRLVKETCDFEIAPRLDNVSSTDSPYVNIYHMNLFSFFLKGG
jgi:hypothetical protein